MKMYQLSDSFGASQLLVICPSYILVNETEETLRITNLPGSSNVISLESEQMIRLDFRGLLGKDNLV